MRATRIAAATLALLAFCAPSGRAQQPTLEHSAVVGGLEDPWDVAFLPAGHMLFTQKCKGLYILPTDASSDTGYATAPTALWGTDPEAAVVADDAFCLGQSGFNGVTVDPAFGAQNRFIYVFFPSSLSTPNTNRVARFSLSADLASVSERTDIVEDIALKNQQSPNGMAGACLHRESMLEIGGERWPVCERWRRMQVHTLAAASALAPTASSTSRRATTTTPPSRRTCSRWAPRCCA